MKLLTRRSFIKKTAVGTGVLAMVNFLPGSLLSMPGSNTAIQGYFESEFGIDNSLCQRLLDRALSKGGDFADLYFEHSISNWVVLEDGKVDKAYANIDLGVGIRTVKGDQTGFGFTQILTEASMINVADTAASIANSSRVVTSPNFMNLNIGNYYPLEKLFTEIPLSSKLPIVKAVNDKCFALSDHVIKVNATLHDSQKRIMIVSSNGTKAEDLIPGNYLSASVVAEKDGKKENSWYNYGGRKDFSYYTTDLADNLANEVVSRVEVLFDAIKPPAGEMPVVLGPGVTGILLHEAIGHGMEADFNRKKISTYANMIGKKVAEPFVTIVDDGTNHNRLGTINIDDEGTESQKTTLVENGILTSYMHDKISAKHYNIKPTGNGRRESYQHFPLPRMRNTYMLPGEANPEDVIKSVEKGIYVKDVSNGQIKIGEGDFAFFVSQGQMIENGKLTFPIKDVNIMGNGPKILQNVTMVANDLKLAESGAGFCGKGGQSVQVGFGLPTCLVKSMTVGGVS